MPLRNPGRLLSATQLNVTNASTGAGIFTGTEVAQLKNAGKWQIPSINITVNSTNYPIDNSNSKSFTTYGYYTLTVDKACTLLVQMWGAGGGTGNASTPGQAGAGGYVEGNVSLSTGITYIFLVGQGGINNSTSTTFPDGGAGTTYAASGGGSTRFGPYTQSGFNLTNSSANYNNTNAVYYLIAGGGGGCANWVNNSNPGTNTSYGGGTSGAGNGAYYSSEGASSPGGGGTQSAGGAGGTGGRLGSGATGAKYAGAPTTFSSTSSGGGGGGYYGGGSGAGYYSSGGGGSGYINATYVTNGTFYTASSGSSNYISPNPRSNKPTNTGNGGGGSVNSVYTGYDGGIIFTLISTP